MNAYGEYRVLTEAHTLLRTPADIVGSTDVTALNSLHETILHSYLNVTRETVVNMLSISLDFPTTFERNENKRLQRIHWSVKRKQKKKMG